MKSNETEIEFKGVKVLVRDLDCVELNADYRLCPEAHYPQPFFDGSVMVVACEIPSF